jgi:hypothetical protein
MFSLFEQGLGTCLRWFCGLSGEERYWEWADRLQRGPAAMGFEVTLVDGLESEPDGSAVVSQQDKVLASYRDTMRLDDAVMALLEIGMEGSRD